MIADRGLALFRLVNPEFGFLIWTVGDGEVVAIEVGRKETGAGSGGGREPSDALVFVGGGLLDDVNEAFTAGEIDAFTFGVVEEVIGIAGDLEVSDWFA
jgi:hypothetical protein